MGSDYELKRLFTRILCFRIGQILHGESLCPNCSRFGFIDGRLLHQGTVSVMCCRESTFVP